MLENVLMHGCLTVGEDGWMQYVSGEGVLGLGLSSIVRRVLDGGMSNDHESPDWTSSSFAFAKLHVQYFVFNFSGVP